METLIVTSEVEIKKWIKDAMHEELSAVLRQLGSKPPNHEEPLLTRNEIAAYCKISLVTLSLWVKKGLPCIRKGGRVLFLKSDVLAAIKDHPVKQTRRQPVR